MLLCHRWKPTVRKMVCQLEDEQSLGDPISSRPPSDGQWVEWQIGRENFDRVSKLTVSYCLACAWHSVRNIVSLISLTVVVRSGFCAVRKIWVQSCHHALSVWLWLVCVSLILHQANKDNNTFISLFPPRHVVRQYPKFGGLKQEKCIPILFWKLTIRHHTLPLAWGSLHKL